MQAVLSSASLHKVLVTCPPCQRKMINRNLPANWRRYQLVKMIFFSIIVLNWFRNSIPFTDIDRSLSFQGWNYTLHSNIYEHSIIFPFTKSCCLWNKREQQYFSLLSIQGNIYINITQIMDSDLLVALYGEWSITIFTNYNI